MTMQEGMEVSRASRGSGDSDFRAALRQLHDRAYLLDLLGDSHNGLGRHDAAIDAYQQAAEGFRDQGAQCSHALCLFKIADSYLSLQEPWHAIGYLKASLPLLHDLGLVRYEALAQHRLVTCEAMLAEARLLVEGRAGQPCGGRRPSGPPESP